MVRKSLSSRRLGVSPAPVAVCLVIFAVGGLLTWWMIKDGEDYKAQLDSKTKELEQTLQQLEGSLGTLGRWEDMVGMSPDTADRLLRESNQRDLMNYTEHMRDIRDKALKGLETAQDELTRTREEADRTVADLSRNTKTMREKIERTLASVYETKERIEKTKASLGKSMEMERERATASDRQLVAFKEGLDKRVAFIQRGVGALRDKIVRVEGELNPPPRAVVEADGRIWHADPGAGIVTINLGLKDRVRRGMVFKVFRQDRAGAMVEKGQIRVTDVTGPHLSVGGTIEIADPLYPFVEGDMVEAPNFPQVKRFVLIGEFLEDEGYSRMEVEGMIREYGGGVMEEVDVDTDFLVVGDLSEERSEWASQLVAAREYRVRILRVPQLVNYVGDYIHHLGKGAVQ